MSGPDGDDNLGARVPGRGDPRTEVRALATGALAFEALALDRDGEIVPASLLQGRRELVIRHAGQRYRLRITANDKLTLTK